jgi:hypothetical protein
MAIAIQAITATHAASLPVAIAVAATPQPSEPSASGVIAPRWAGGGAGDRPCTRSARRFSIFSASASTMSASYSGPELAPGLESRLDVLALHHGQIPCALPQPASNLL